MAVAPVAAETQWKWHLSVIGVAILLTAIAYANATGGSFVYDDESQIVKNPAIQTGGNLGQALFSDVWAFRSVAGETRSNYWRPVFVAWLAMNYRLFGLQPTGWHILNILAHLLVTLLAYRLLVALQFVPAVCAIATWGFAAHPAHVQSVTWISGAPDVVMTAFLFGSLLCYLAARKNARWGYTIAATLLYALALLSKETALTFIPILFGLEIVWRREQGTVIKSAAVSALKICLPFIATGLLFVLVRYLILHQMRQLEPGAPGFVEVLLTQPAIILFYVRQAFLPFIFGPIYGVRYVNAGNIGLTNFLLPLLLLAAVAYVSYWLFKRAMVYRIGLLLFFLPLILLLDPRVFLPELLVQDRYLYLPIIGAMIIIVGGLAELAERFIRSNAQMKERAVLAAGLLIACMLTVVTLRYNPVWNNNIALWEQGIRVDPSSSLAYGLLGIEYQQAGRLTEAKAMIGRALEIKPDLTLAHITRGIIALHDQRYKDAEQDLQPVLNQYPELDAAREQLAVIYQQEGRFDEAIALSQEGRRLSPARYGLYTINIAVLHKLAGRDSNALAELESLLPVLNSSHDPNLFIAWWYLGALYRDQGKVDSAVNAFERYLRATDGINDPKVKNSRDLAVQNLQQMKAIGK